MKKNVVDSRRRFFRKEIRTFKTTIEAEEESEDLWRGTRRAARASPKERRSMSSTRKKSNGDAPPWIVIVMLNQRGKNVHHFEDSGRI